MHSKSEIKSTVANSVLGVNVAGYVNSEFGLGEAVRGTIKAIEATGIPFFINNCTFNPHRKLDSSYQDFTEANPYPINIVQVNVDLINTFISSVNQNYFKDRYNIGFWAWELQTFPQEWKQAFNIFNEIWTCSSYCVESIAMISPVPVIKVMHSISLLTPSIHREMLGLPSGKFTFLFIFDFCSEFERKNPIATIKAFKQAFGLNDDVLLVIKCSNAEQFPDQREQLKELVSGDPSIKLIDGYLLRDEINALIYNCDCYVSLHRSEGFGLTMAEAMYYGKPVIATAYSANTEYMNVGNSFLVKYDLVTLSEDFGPYKKGNLWANPDTDHAASLMRYVFDNYEEAKRVGKRASQEVRSLLNPQAIGSKIRSRLEYVGLVTNGFTTISPLDQAQAKITQLHTELVRSQSQLQQTQAELVGSQSQLQQTQAELVGSQSQLQQTQAELVGSQSQLQQTQAELVGSQSQLQQTQLELVGSQSQLQHIQAELDRSQGRIAAMESSKFWKLRTVWFRLRKLIGIVGDE